MTDKHTLGKWQLGHLLIDSDRHLSVHDERGWIIASCDFRNRPSEESQANATLIARVPEMLEKLNTQCAFILKVLAEANRRAKAGLKHTATIEFQDYPKGTIEVGTALDAIDFVTSSAAHMLFEKAPEKPEDVDAFLRASGFDPDKLGKEIEAVVQAALRTALNEVDNGY